MSSKKIYHHEVNSHRVDHFFLNGKCSCMTENDVALICQNHNIPIEYRTRLPCPEENYTIDVEERWMSVHEASFCLAFHLLLHDFGLKVLRYSGLAPGQLHPNGWAQIGGFFVICHENDINPTVDFLYCLFHLRLVKERYGMYTLQ